METKKKKYSIEKHPNAHRRLLKVKPVVNMLENFNRILTILTISLIIVLVYLLLPNDIRDIICFIFVPIISAVVTPLIINVINKSKETKYRRFDNNRTIYLELGEILLNGMINDDYSEEKRVEFQTFIAKNYNYMSINFSPSMNAAIYSAYLAYEAKNKQNFTFFAKECIICMNDENGYGPYCTYQSFMLDFIKDCEKNKKSDESVEFQCLK